MAVKKKTDYILSKHLKEKKRKKPKRRKAWIKGFFRERKNKGTYHQTLQNTRVSDRQDHSRYMIT